MTAIASAKKRKVLSESRYFAKGLEDLGSGLLGVAVEAELGFLDRELAWEFSGRASAIGVISSSGRVSDSLRLIHYETSSALGFRAARASLAFGDVMVSVRRELEFGQCRGYQLPTAWVCA